MRLVLLLRTTAKYRPVFTPLSERLHKKNIDISGSIITVGPGGLIDVDISTPEALRSAMRKVCYSVGDNLFVLSQDNIFPVNRYDASVPRCHLKSNWNKRKGADVESMVQSVSYLMDNGCRVMDYEIELPQVIDSGKMDAMLSDTMGMDIHIRTTYFNLYHAHPERVPDPRLELWINGTNPEGDVVSLADTCYRHKKCLTWLNKKLHGKPV